MDGERDGWLIDRHRQNRQTDTNCTKAETRVNFDLLEAIRLTRLPQQLIWSRKKHVSVVQIGSSREGSLLTDVDIYDANRSSCKTHTVYCGTTIVGAQPRDGCVRAVVVKTGQLLCKEIE